MSEVHVDDHGAAGDDDGTGNGTDDTAAFQSAIASLQPRGGIVRFGAKQYHVTLPIKYGESISLAGDNMFGSRIVYTGTGYAISCGNDVLGSGLAYGVGARDFSILLLDNFGDGITFRETCGAHAQNIYIEGNVETSKGTSVFIDGGDSANLFSRLDNIISNHNNIGFRLGSTGSNLVTTVTATNCNAFGDYNAGSGNITSVGIQSNAGHGLKSRFYGGNLENCADGIECSGSGVFYDGVSFEANGTDVRLNSTAVSHIFSVCADLQKVTNNSTSRSNRFLNCLKSASAGIPYGLPYSGTFTRDMSLASGSQEISGIGYRPYTILFLAYVDGTDKMSVGFCQSNFEGGALSSSSVCTGSSNQIHISAGGSSYTGTITSTVDGFVVHWTRIGSPSGIISCRYLVN